MYDSSPMPRKTVPVLVASTLAMCSVAFAQQRLLIPPVPRATLLLITKAEDQRRWDDELRNLLTSPNSSIRKRAALAAGRIGDENSIPDLTSLLEKDRDPGVRAMAAFALGEVESAKGANALVTVLKNPSAPGELRARTIEALGKIAGALPSKDDTRRELGAVILEALKVESGRVPSNEYTIILGLTAALRAQHADSGPIIAKFLTHSNSRVRSDAGNALARLRLNHGNADLRRLLTSDPDPNVRANAARVLGLTEDKASFDALVSKATGDVDSRVRVSAIRALASLKDPRAAQPLLKQGESLTDKDATTGVIPAEINEALEIATTLGRLLAQKEDPAAVDWLRKGSSSLNHRAPEVEVATVRIAPATYLKEFGTAEQAKRKVQETMLLDWRAASGIAAGLGEIAALPDSVSNKAELASAAQALLRAMLDYRNSGLTINTLVAVHTEYAVPDVLRALAAFKPQDMATIARAHLKESDVTIQETAAGILGDLPPSEENTRALAAALPQAINNKASNDAALSILGALGDQKTEAANEQIKTGLKSTDILVRRRAATLLKANGAGDFTSQIGTVQTRNTNADYARAIGRIGRNPRAVVTTSKGSFTIELLPEAAPLTVDNFVQLAQREYFRNVTFHRVVPNFVIQGGDPRGDGNGGPGYAIRCEINHLMYDRAALGMALSGKDTGGSQWFVTHAPQPHLDGGYTIFGRVVAGMDVVDRIVRGDVIQSIVIKQDRK